jgi:PAS domain S-box-containing protein
LSDNSTLDDLSIRPVLFLGFLAASTPTALLIAYRQNVSPVWHGPVAHAIIYLSITLLALIIANWLNHESKINRHPALAVLSGGFIGMAVTALISAGVRSPLHLLVVRTFSMAWTMGFGGFAVILLNWQAFRRQFRQVWTERPVIFYSLPVLWFSFLVLAAFLLDKPLFHSAAYAGSIRLFTFWISTITISAVLFFAIRLYLRKRNTVILFFSLGLYLYALSILGETGAPEWSLLWWFSEGMGLISVFAIAYGILEARRVRDRLDLIKTLAARSDELQKSHRDLMESEIRYRSLVNNSPYGIFRLNDSRRFDAVNPALFELLGYDSGQPLMELESCGDLFKNAHEYDGLMSELQRTGSVQEDVLWKKKDGHALKVRLLVRRFAAEDMRHSSYEGMVEDLSAQSSLEDQLRQSQKMEAVGRLAGGMAHDFNNLLTVISGYTGMLIDTLSESDPRRKDAERVKHASERAASLTRQLLAFSRKQVLTPAIIHLNMVVADLSRMLPRLIGEDIDLAFVPGEQLAFIYADRGQVEQVLMNLVVNARDAMPEGGKITIETKNERLEAKYARQRRGVIPGEYVMLAVTDTGCGMDAATQARIFEPFFTTKEEGKGTGLGLATVYGIVKQSDGHISVYSEPGQGTTFKVYFPATSVARKTENEALPGSHEAHGETILVVEDETDVRNMIVRALGRRNYRLLEAANGEEAVKLVKQHNNHVDLMITDIIMPGMRGTEAAQRIVSMVPEMKVLYMSGYTDNAMFHQKLLDAGTLFIQKPFTLAGLEEKVRQALEPKARSAKAGD